MRVRGELGAIVGAIIRGLPRVPMEKDVKAARKSFGP